MQNAIAGTKLMAEQLSATSHFTNDLGLDSLDTVEVVMAIEEVRGVIQQVSEDGDLQIAQEFSIEIPDKEADAIHSGMCKMDLWVKSNANVQQWSKP